MSGGINWIKITDRARDGINIINGLPYDVFLTVLEYVHRQMSSNSVKEARATEDGANLQQPEPDKHSKEDEVALEDLERLVGVPREQFLLLIKTFSYILRRIGTYLIRPSVLQRELRDTLQLLDEAKVEAIVRLWNRETTPLLRNLANTSCEHNQVSDIAWKLNVEISSQCQQRQKAALALLQLRTETGDDLNLELDHSQLYRLYRQLEEIQSELDSLSGLPGQK